jgi:threonine dehydrogenase-like Zn-dependent dehydrogenase
MALLCALPNARRLIAVDGVAVRRELATRLGGEAVEPEAAAGLVAEATDGLGADVVVEAAGSPGGLDASLKLARGRGVVSVVGAHFEPDYPLDNGRMFERELTLCFSIGDPTADGPALLERLVHGELDPAPVVTHRMALDQAAEAYRLFDSREATKVVLAP